jgi:hypothetical protein
MSEPFEPGSFLRRYQAGEHEAVWQDMTGLGAAVREPLYFDDAWSVARETMKRARRNVELIIERLDAIGYQFWNGEQGTLGPQDLRMSFGGQVVSFDSPLAAARQALGMDLSRIPGGMGGGARQAQQLLASLIGPYQAMKAQADERQQARIRKQAQIQDHLKDPNVFAPPTADEINFIRGLEKKGMFLPLSWRAWIEEVGDVNLAGAHPALSFWEGADFPGVYADPLMVTLEGFNFEIESWERDYDDGEAPGSMAPIIGWDAQMKARLAVAKDQLDEGYSIEIPNSSADGRLRMADREIGFVEYLRNAFRWGGFPGWEGQASRPEAELKILTEGLLPI